MISLSKTPFCWPVKLQSAETSSFSRSFNRTRASNSRSRLGSEYAMASPLQRTRKNRTQASGITLKADGKHAATGPEEGVSLRGCAENHLSLPPTSLGKLVVVVERLDALDTGIVNLVTDKLAKPLIGVLADTRFHAHPPVVFDLTRPAENVVLHGFLTHMGRDYG